MLCFKIKIILANVSTIEAKDLHIAARLNPGLVQDRGNEQCPRRADVPFQRCQVVWDYFAYMGSKPSLAMPAKPN